MATTKGVLNAQDVEFSPSVLELMKKLERDNENGDLTALKDSVTSQQAIRSSRNSPREMVTREVTDSPAAKVVRDYVQSPEVVALPKDDGSALTGKNKSYQNETPGIVGSIRVDESFHKEQSIRCTPMNPWYLSNGLPSFAKKSSKRTFIEFMQPTNECISDSSSTPSILVPPIETDGKTNNKVILETSILSNAIKSETKKNQEFMSFLESVITKI